MVSIGESCGSAGGPRGLNIRVRMEESSSAGSKGMGHGEGSFTFQAGGGPVEKAGLGARLYLKCRCR